jgi:hypothetical protein
MVTELVEVLKLGLPVEVAGWFHTKKEKYQSLYFSF